MNREEKMAFGEKKARQDRFTIRFKDAGTLNAFMTNDFVKEHIEVVSLFRKNLKGDIAFDKSFSAEVMAEKLVTELGVAQESLTVTHKGQGLSNLYPL